VTFKASLHPDRLGASTTVSIGFYLATSDSSSPLVPLRGFDIRLPRGMGFASSTLGLAVCPRDLLLASGAAACPSGAAMGRGSAQVQASFGEEVVREFAPVSIFMTEPVEEATTMLFYFDGRHPLIAPVALQTKILTRGLDSVLSTTVPAIATSSDGPEVTIVALKASIGPNQLRYFKRVDDHIVAYRPVGLNTPERCPPGGFQFGADFNFADGAHVTAHSVVPCPAHGRRRVERGEPNT
jgi:hypothetical protein